MNLYRFAYVERTGQYQTPIIELHEPSQEETGDWLSLVIKLASKKYPDIQEYIANAFSKGSRCAIANCEGATEVGARVTFDGKCLLIIPCCKEHGTEGKLDELNRRARLKPFQFYAKFSLKPGIVTEDQEGNFHLIQALPTAVDV